MNEIFKTHTSTLMWACTTSLYNVQESPIYTENSEIEGKADPQKPDLNCNGFLAEKTGASLSDLLVGLRYVAPTINNFRSNLSF